MRYLRMLTGLFALSFALTGPFTGASRAQLPASYDFESGPQGWTSVDLSGRGDFADLFPGLTVVQQDPNIKNATQLWGFFKGSLYDYACGGFPQQQVVPHEDGLLRYIENEIWSPALTFAPPPFPALRLEFDVYEDLPLDNLVYYTWKVRLFDGAWSPWHLGGELYSIIPWPRAWSHRSFYIDDTVVPGGITSTTTMVQVALGVVDRCGTQCGIVGSGACHSHAPLFDNVTISAITDPEWVVELKDLFQDSFPDDGTTNGVVRVDPPGTSQATVRLLAPFGLSADATNPAEDAVYMFVKDIGAKSGNAIAHPGGDFPVVLTPAVAGWTTIRMKSAGLNTYEADLKDDLYTPGDVVEYFFAAQDAAAAWTYWSEHTGTTAVLADVTAAPSEMTCLPTPGRNMLYVDGVDGDDDQLFYDGFFASAGLTASVDRYDLRSPRHADGGLGGRVSDVAVQLAGSYDAILWSSGDAREGTLGDGTGGSSDDYAALNEFLDQHPGSPGLFLEGNGVAEALWASSGGSPSATNFVASYLPFTLSYSCHLGFFPSSPTVIGLMPSTIFQGPPLAPGTPWQFAAVSDGHCFDTAQGLGTTTDEMVFENNAGAGAILRNNSAVTANSGTITVQMSTVAYKRIGTVPGFPLVARTTLAASQVPARYYFLHKVLEDMGIVAGTPADAGTPPRGVRTALMQNHPNPFNPVTSIRYFIERSSDVTLAVFDVSGRRVRTLVDGFQAPRGGGFTVEWDGTDDKGDAVASGVYFYRLTAGAHTDVKKMMLLK